MPKRPWFDRQRADGLAQVQCFRFGSQKAFGIFVKGLDTYRQVFWVVPLRVLGIPVKGLDTFRQVFWVVPSRVLGIPVKGLDTFRQGFWEVSSGFWILFVRDFGYLCQGVGEFPGARRHPKKFYLGKYLTCRDPLNER
jgi:hypothetical protein